MRTTSIVRHIDGLGRVTIPKEIRSSLDIGEGDPLEILVGGCMIMFRKYNPGCYICSGHGECRTFHGKQICTSCIKQAAALMKA